jgi:hypothetical protein
MLDRIVYATDQQKNALTLAFTASHTMESLRTQPRILVTSRDPLSGKTTVLDAAMMLCQNGWMADPTSFALRAKFAEPEKPTLVFDEISKIFGENGLRGRSNPLYKPLVEGYRKTATMSMSVDRTAVDVSSYCFAVLAGLKTAAPADLRTRSIIIMMRPVPRTITLEDSLDPGVEADGERVREQIHNWVGLLDGDVLATSAANARRYHPALRNRKLQIWGPLFAIAEQAQNGWPERVLDAFSTLALDASEKPVLSAEEQILDDAGRYLADPEHAEDRYLTSATLLRHIRTLDEKLYTSKSDRQIAQLMAAGLGKASVLTFPDRHTAKGWRAAEIRAAYTRLREEIEPEMEEQDPDEYDSFFDVETTETTETTVPAPRATEAA